MEESLKLIRKRVTLKMKNNNKQYLDKLINAIIQRIFLFNFPINIEMINIFDSIFYKTPNLLID